MPEPDGKIAERCSAIPQLPDASYSEWPESGDKPACVESTADVDGVRVSFTAWGPTVPLAAEALRASLAKLAAAADGETEAP